MCIAVVSVVCENSIYTTPPLFLVPLTPSSATLFFGDHHPRFLSLTGWDICVCRCKLWVLCVKVWI